MRKFLAVLLSVMLVMSASITVFGATTADVDKILEASVKFAYGDMKAFDVSESKDYYLYLSAGEYDEKLQESYFNSVKNSLDGGGRFDIGTLGLIISNFIMSSEDPTDFEGYDLLELFEKTQLGENDNLYTYMYAADIAFLFDFEDLGKQLCDTIASKYIMGEGTDFWGGWGTSADDLSVFILTLCNYYDDYKEYVDDAASLLKAYNTDAGYDNYGANANSTALALAAYVALDDEKSANDAYSKLMLFYNEETGSFNSNYDDVLATKDAVFGLSCYRLLADFGEDDNNYPSTGTDKEEKPTSATVNIKDKNDKENASSSGTANNVKSPATGAQTSVIIASFAMLASGCAMLAAKKKHK